MAYIGVPPADRTSGARVRDEFTADGTQVCFQLSQEVPGSFESNIIAVVENVIQEPVSAYTIIDTVTVALTSISGTFTKNETITGGTSAATGKVIQVNAGSVVITVTTGTFQAAESITGGSSSATATISTLTTNIGRGLNFSGTPTTGTKIYALHQASATYNLKPAAGSVTPDSLSENLRTFTVDKFTATSSQTAFTLSTAPVSVKSILVFIDGVMQSETTHYTLSGVTLTIGASLTAGQQVTVVHLGFSTVSRTAFVDSSVTTAMIADGAITADKIANGTIIAADVADGAITTAKLNSTLDLSGKTITYRSIVAGDLASNAITTAKITDANVTAAKLASGAAVSNIGYTPANKAGDTFTGYVEVGNTVRVTSISNPASGAGMELAYDGTQGIIQAYSNRGALTSVPVYFVNGQIKFPASQNASSDANTLDDYEEGSWSPDARVAGRTSTWGTRNGRYVKIGKVVHCWVVCDGGSSGATDTYSVLSALPFTPAQGYNNQTGGIWAMNNAQSTKTGNIMINNGDTTALISLGGGSWPHAFDYFSCYFSYLSA